MVLIPVVADLRVSRHVREEPVHWAFLLTGAVVLVLVALPAWDGFH